MSEELQYYLQQAGTGIAVHEGSRFQRGHGFWGKLLKWAAPVFRFLGKQALSTGSDIAKDVLLDAKDVGQSIRKRVGEAGNTILEKGLDKVKEYAQKGGKRKYKFKTNRKKKRAKLTGRNKKSKKINQDLIFP